MSGPEGRGTASWLFLKPGTDPAAVPEIVVPVTSPRHVPPSGVKPKPLGSLVASAQRLTSESLRGKHGTAVARSWQEDAWDMFDLVGEQRFLANTLAGRLAQARLFVGLVDPERPADDPTQCEDAEINGVLTAVGGSAPQRAQMIERLGVNLFVAGDGWLVGIPKRLVPGTPEYREALAARRNETFYASVDPRTALDLEELSISDLDWRMLSASEVSSSATGLVTIKIGEGLDDKIEAKPEDIYLIRVWRPHPRRAWEATSPTKASLPVLRELVGLTMDVTAQVESRLAGAGLLIVPQSAQRALQVAAGLDADSDEDVFIEALLEAMVTPISDRGNASAVVPLTITVPDESTQYFRHISFARPLDASGVSMREEAIRRLALGQDAPPELLLGTAGMNHWGAWLVREDVVTTHLEPPLALICDALTTQYLWPVLEEMGMEAEEYRKYVVWYDVSDLVARPNRSDDAKDLHSREVINDEALRRETGFDEGDAPSLVDVKVRVTDFVLDLIRANPALVADPGIAVLKEQIAALIEGRDQPEMPSEPVPEPVTDESQEAPVDGPPSGPNAAPELASVIRERMLV